METFAAKTVLLALTHEHRLYVDSLTTDRSSTMRTMIRCAFIFATKTS